MFRNAIVGLVIVTVALALPLASAGSTAYRLNIGQMDDFVVEGSNPALDQVEGTAEITQVIDLGGGFLEVTVKCLDTSPVNCHGFIVTS